MEKSSFVVLRRGQVEARTGMRRSTLYKHIAAGVFPEQIKLGAKSVGWLENEVDDWIKAQAAKRGMKNATA